MSRREIDVFVPGRIEFLGKHTDYAGGRSLVCAIERGITIRASARSDRILTVSDAFAGGTFSAEIGPDMEVPSGNWLTYPLTTARRLARNFSGMIAGADLTITSNLPQAVGLSSSSAMITGCFIVLSRLSKLQHTSEYHPLRSPEREAEYASCIENGRDFHELAGDAGVGTLGGSQDHAAILLSEANRLLLLGYAPLRREDSLPLPPGHIFAVATSGVIAKKTGAAQAGFNRLARIAERILTVARAVTGGTPMFRAVETDPGVADRIRQGLEASAGEFEPGDLIGRFEQMMLEVTVLIPDAVQALRTGDLALLRQTVDVSQVLAERLLGNQVPTTIALVREARAAGALAASSFGAGFGGSVWALVSEAGGREFLQDWERGYAREFPGESGGSSFFLTRAGQPLTVL